MHPIQIVFSENPIDQRHLGQSGGSISFTACGLPVFHFENREQFQAYLLLKEEVKPNEKG
ncbi:hypothetical protein [Bacillus mojavensis]|uniref:hypothetical protein n=1 Tax=Bacillus mojavensis TaxID=72360 RepID=UPI002DB6A7B4|nr:hypothetical protein [Bacillus mojavensis]MEC1615282.1 hypothetical protein [Bacillus mojavensis]MEC1635692.1 hypothetical protein [Bacillus mojavensis]MEC1682860.1 hypothetical protein [Bacillus mojavensis]MEC1693164.1 hypothetical protein [Bacillus mojavensis]MEC1707249.1 hypothetical protein [Bacillus mojavensis]